MSLFIVFLIVHGLKMDGFWFFVAILIYVITNNNWRRLVRQVEYIHEVVVAASKERGVKR